MTEPTTIVAAIIAAAVAYLGGYLVGASRPCADCEKRRKEWYGQ